MRNRYLRADGVGGVVGIAGIAGIVGVVFVSMLLFLWVGSFGFGVVAQGASQESFAGKGCRATNGYQLDAINTRHAPFDRSSRRCD